MYLVASRMLKDEQLSFEHNQKSKISCKMSYTSINSSWIRFIKCKIKNTLDYLLGSCILVVRGLGMFGQHLYQEIHCLEQIFIKMTHIYSFVCQLFLFTMVEMAFPDKTLKKDERIVAGLTTLLFYSVIGYFVNRIKDIYIKNWNRTLRNDSSLRNCLFWICKIVVEWLKAVVVIICLKEQGMKYRPRFATTVLTFGYYLCTEKIFTELICQTVIYFDVQIFENLEHLILPIAFNVYTLVSAFFVTCKLALSEEAKYAILASYFVLYLRVKDLVFNYVKVLVVERQTYASFRQATDKDIQEWDDICAVCLNRMSRARITPCNHLFHPSCLKQCLKSSYQCPLCKCDFVK